MRALRVAVLALFALSLIAVRGAENGTENDEDYGRVTSIEFKSDKSEIDFGRSVATDEFKARSDVVEDVFYDEYEEENNDVSERSESRRGHGKGTTTFPTSAEVSDARGVPTEVFPTMGNLSEDGDSFRTFNKRNDPVDLQASASDNDGVASAGTAAEGTESGTSNSTTEQGWNSRAYRDAKYPLELSIVAEEPVQHVLLPYQHASIDAPDLSDCARQGEWRPIGEIHVDTKQKDLQQEHDYLIPSGSHDVHSGGFGIYGSNFGSGEHSFHGFYGGGGISQGSFAEFQKLTADAASAQSAHGGFGLGQHLQNHVAGSVSSHSPSFGGVGDGGGGGGGFGNVHKGTGAGALAFSPDFGKIPLNHNFKEHGDHHGGGAHKFYHGQGNLIPGTGTSGHGRPKQPGPVSFGSASSGSVAFLRGKPGGHQIRYAPGGFGFNRKPGPSAFGDMPGLSLPPKSTFLRGKRPGGIAWKSQKIKGGGGGGTFRRPNFDSLKTGPHLDVGFLAGSEGPGPFLGGHGGSGSPGTLSSSHGGSGLSGAVTGVRGSSSGILHGGQGGSGSAGALLGASSEDSFGSFGHGGSGSSGAQLGGHGSSSLYASHDGGLGAPGYSGTISGYGGLSSGGFLSGFGKPGSPTDHKGVLDGGSHADNSLLSGHAESAALTSALADHGYVGQNIGHITHEAILQDSSQLTSFTCGKNHDHGTNYHTASFQVSDDDHGSQDLLQYQDGAHVIIHAPNNGFDDVIHAERKQSNEGGDSSAAATNESSGPEIITGSMKGASNHRYAESGNNDENSGTSDQIEEPTSHSFYRDKFPSTENSPDEFEYELFSNSEKPEIIKELEELSSRFQLDLDNAKYSSNSKGVSYETLFGDRESEKSNPVIRNGFGAVSVDDFDVNPKEVRGFRYEERQNDGDVITEYPYYAVHQGRDVPENLPVVISEHHPHSGDKPKTHVPPKRKHPGKQYEVHENSGEKQIPTKEIFPPQKFPRQFHNPMPNLAGRPSKEGSKYHLSSPYGHYPILSSVPFKKFKKYKPIPAKSKLRRPTFVRRPIPITSAPIVRVSVSS